MKQIAKRFVLILIIENIEVQKKEETRQLHNELKAAWPCPPDLCGAV